MDDLYDVILVGGGPAGLTAALYLARAKYRVLVLERDQLGGQITITEQVVNYPGIPSTSGSALTESMAAQAKAFGAEFLMDEAIGFDLESEPKIVKTAQRELRCLAILLATGAHPRTVGFLGESQYKGRGVAYCATCDGEFFTDKEVYVVGGGYAAAEESVFLTKFARHVTILIRKGDFSCAASVADQAKNHEKITVLTNTVLEEVAGENAITYLRYQNTVTGAVTEVNSPPGETMGVFVFGGYAPETGLVKDLVALDSQGYIITDDQQKTSRDGVFAAGDVCIKALRQVVTATGDGAIAATALEKYVLEAQGRTGLHGVRPTAPAPQQTEAAPPISGNSFSPEMEQQLKTLFLKMERPLQLELHLSSSALSRELEALIANLANLSEKLTIKQAPTHDQEVPWVSLCHQDGTDTGLAFHGVPGGHEFTSFVLGLYNAAGPGQPLEPEQKKRISTITQRVDMQILVSLSCTMCPDLVTAAQRIAVENPNITAHVYDIRHFQGLKDQYNVMSVPCLVVNGAQVYFGKKNVEQLLALLPTEEK